MPEKMQGVIAELKTFNAEGKQVDHEFIFKPFCDWWIGKLGDYLGCTKYQDIGAVIDEFGVAVAEKVVEGEVVPVERELSDREIIEKDLRQVSCTIPIAIERKESEIRYPFPGGRKEYLVKRWEQV